MIELKNIVYSDDFEISFFENKEKGNSVLRNF